MGTLRKLADGTEVPMPARLVVGRAHTAGLRLQTVVASGEHASLLWTGDHWEVRDLGSTNGTLLDKVRLEPGKPTRVARGAQLMFGGPGELWELASDAAPDALAIDLESGAPIVGRQNLLVLPSLAEPRLSIYKGAFGDWALEPEDGNVRGVFDQEVVEVGGRSYRVHLPMQAEGTPMVEPKAALATVGMLFRVAKHEETIDIDLSFKGRTVTLESRGHGYVLLTLARARRRDEQLPVAERGWIERDELLGMLAMDANALNVAIHRARQQLLAAGVEDAHGIVEVRRGQRRFGTDRFEIVVG